jgi:hypothetical protein
LHGRAYTPPMRARTLALLVPGSMAVLLGVQVLLGVLDGPRATAPGLFSVHVPSGWRQVGTRGAGPYANHPDVGALELDGPGQRRVYVDWSDVDLRHGESFANGFDVTAQHEADLGVRLAGQDVAVIVWHTVDDANGGIEADVATMQTLEHPLGSRTVAYAALCGVGPPTSWNWFSRGNRDWSWCLGILDSWRWETSTS